jgi:lysophospholipase L1-like esterase
MSQTEPATKAPVVKKKCRRWRWVFLAVALILVVGEVAVRVLADSNSKFNVFIGAIKEFDPELQVRLKRDYHSGTIHINSKGFLGPEFEAQKKPGAYRIVALGDSCSFMPEGRNYPRVLEELLRENLAGRQVEVINASVPGYGSDQARRWYEREVDAYDHDMLLVYLGWNDMAQYNPDGLVFKLEDRGYLKEPSLIDRAVINCYLLRSLYVVQGYRERSRPVSLEPLTTEDEKRYQQFYPTHFEDNVSEIIKRAKARGRKVFVIRYASLLTDSPSDEELARMHFPRGVGKSLPKYRLLLSAYTKALDQIASQTQTPVIDIAPLFTTTESRTVFTDTMHFDERGAEMIAQRVMAEILPHIRQ